MAISFSAFCEELGVPLYNKAWSWCAFSEERQLALFTVWEDGVVDDCYTFTTKPRPGETRKRPGRTELISVLEQAVDKGFAAYGIQCRAADVNAIPRKRQSFDSIALLDLRVRRNGDGFLGRIVGRIPSDVVRACGAQSAWIASTAINDIDPDAVGNTDPEYRKRMGGAYVRDGRIRARVLERAKGNCEFCGAHGFMKPDGEVYLETHHIISLSEQGTDRVSNVIALCANDHRRAHYGEDWAVLQDEFLEILKKYKSES